MPNDKSKPAVLFLCSGNSCRSQMSEGFLREHGRERYAAYSAGTDPAERLHPIAIEVMAEKGIDISDQVPVDVGAYLGRLAVRHLIVVCDAANEKCPRIFPGMMNRMFWPFDDPASFVGSHAATLEKFRAVRDQIETRIKQWLEEE
ncbi:MAG TPA: arsenate reductase ArsC [Lacipirellulaceae bacterium]|nr:arsenate reductase ArsC [Lacipirellulaceae bacterium]